RTQVVDPDAGTVTFAFDAAGQQTSQTDAKGQVVMLGYDILGRLTSKTAGGVTTTWTYDQARAGYYNLGHLTTMSGYSNEMYDYDVAVRSVRQSKVIDAATYTVYRSYDAAGRLLGIK